VVAERHVLFDDVLLDLRLALPKRGEASPAAAPVLADDVPADDEALVLGVDAAPVSS
jgi:hypothetical protein